MAEMNVGADPINPAYYAGTACAEIIEHMPTNVGFAAKYAWRLGEKDDEQQEIKKAIWYLQRQQDLFNYRPRNMMHYAEYAQERVTRAMQAGKLTSQRGMIINNLIIYTWLGDRKVLQNAINGFQSLIK